MLTIPAFADEAEIRNNGVLQTIQTENYKYTFFEKTSDNYALVRTFDNSTVKSKNNENEGFGEIKSILVALGLEEGIVNRLSDNTLHELATSNQIMTTTTYSKYDENGNLVYVPEEIALTESLRIQAECQLDNNTGISTQGYEDTYRDSYMKLTYLVSHLGNGEHLFSIDAVWLTDPFWQGLDSIGACAMNFTVDNSSRSGFYYYTKTVLNHSDGTSSEAIYGNNIASSDMENAVNGNWYGSAAILNLPNDIHTEYSSTVYSNYTAHYQYKGHIAFPDVHQWFNTVGSYYHSTIAIAISPSISIKLNGSASASIGIHLQGVTDKRSVEFNIEYTGPGIAL